MKEYENALKFWNEQFSNRPKEIINEKVSLHESLDNELSLMLNNCKKVIDFGCGSGWALFEMYQIGKLEYGLGIDQSINAIENCIEVSNLSGFDNKLEFRIGDLQTLKSLPNDSFDAAFTSNVLDTIPNQLAIDILKEMQRIVRKNGEIIILLNPHIIDPNIFGLSFGNLSSDTIDEPAQPGHAHRSGAFSVVQLGVALGELDELRH